MGRRASQNQGRGRTAIIRKIQKRGVIKNSYGTRGRWKNQKNKRLDSHKSQGPILYVRRKSKKSEHSLIILRHYRGKKKLIVVKRENNQKKIRNRW